MLIKVTEIYFGKDVSLRVEDLLKTRIDVIGGS